MGRTSRFAWLLALAPVAAYACGGSDNTSIDAGTDATLDAPAADSPSGDTRNDSAGGTDAGNDSAQGTDAGDDGSPGDAGTGDAGDAGKPFECGFPAQCIDGGNWDAAYPPDSGEVCCATLVLTGPNVLSCKFSSLTTQCTNPSVCPSTLNTSSCGTDVFRACAHTSECTEATYNQCCDVPNDAGIKAHVCMNSTMITFLKATCIP